MERWIKYLVAILAALTAFNAAINAPPNPVSRRAGLDP